MTDDVERIRPLDLLDCHATGLGAVIAIESTCDRRDGQRRRFRTNETGAQLRRLVVVRPVAKLTGYSRWDRLQRGTVLAARDVLPGRSLDALAVEIVDELERARRTA